MYDHGLRVPRQPKLGCMKGALKCTTPSPVPHEIAEKLVARVHKVHLSTLFLFFDWPHTVTRRYRVYISAPYVHRVLPLF